MPQVTQVFFDLDDVLNTFTDSLMARHGQTYDENADLDWDLQACCGLTSLPPDVFWSTIPEDVWAIDRPTPFTPWLLDTLPARLGRKNVFVCTTPTLQPSSWSGKARWMNAQPLWLRRNFILTPHKHLLARPDRLLIDDRESNVDAWREHGGQAVLVPKPWNSRRGESLYNAITDIDDLTGIEKHFHDATQVVPRYGNSWADWYGCPDPVCL